MVAPAKPAAAKADPLQALAKEYTTLYTENASKTKTLGEIKEKNLVNQARLARLQMVFQ